MNKLMIFAAGAVVGAVVTWKFVKTKYEQIAQEEIDSVKEMFSDRNKTENDVEGTDTEEPKKTVTNEKPDIKEYAAILEQQGYSLDEKGANKNMVRPYVISPDEFGDKDYTEESLTYYSDGILANDMDEVISEEEIDTLIGHEALSSFGEYEDDSVFVRNDETETDYEILLDDRKFYDMED